MSKKTKTKTVVFKNVSLNEMIDLKKKNKKK